MIIDFQTVFVCIYTKSMNSTFSVPGSLVAGAVFVHNELETVDLRVTGSAELESMSMDTLNSVELTCTGSATFSMHPTVTAVSGPSEDNELTHKQYVDAQVSAHVQGLRPKAEVVVASTGNITNLSGSSFEVDGIYLSGDDRVLVKDQSNATENNIYTIPSNGLDTWVPELTSGNITNTYVFVQEGETNKNSAWLQSTHGTAPLLQNWVVFSHPPNAVDLSFVPSSENVSIACSDGDDALIAPATLSLAGIMGSSQARRVQQLQIKVDGDTGTDSETVTIFSARGFGMEANTNYRVNVEGSFNDLDTQDTFELWQIGNIRVGTTKGNLIWKPVVSLSSSVFTFVVDNSGNVEEEQGFLTLLATFPISGSRKGYFTVSFVKEDGTFPQLSEFIEDPVNIL
jgi:hypothetical protein